MLFLTLLLIILMGDRTEYYLKPVFSAPEVCFLLTGLVICSVLLSVIIFADKRYGDRINRFLHKHGTVLTAVLSVILFVSEFHYISAAFFYSDWDPAGVLDCVYKLLRGNGSDISLDYFSAHPNNLMLVFVYLSILKMVSVFGTETVIALCVFQALLFTLGGVLLIKTLSAMFSAKAGFIAWFIYALWIGFNPYILITYSDAAGLIFPLIMLRLFQLAVNENNGSKRIVLMALSGITAAFGYAVKPQTVIVFVAVLIILVLRLFFRGEKKSLKMIAVSGAFLLLAMLFINMVIYPSLGLKLDKDKSFSMSHYLMMGLNPVTDGVYSNEDTEFTNSIKDPGERRKENLRIASGRLKEYGLKGLLGHIERKQLINFSDGTFSWGIDGNFFAGTSLGDMPEVDDSNPLRPLIHSFIISGEKNNGSFRNIMQVFWLTVLFFGAAGEIMLLFRIKKNGFEGNPAFQIEGVIFLSLAGLIVFELLFEAKARYLFTFLPVFLISGIYGAHGIFRILRKRLPS